MDRQVVTWEDVDRREDRQAGRWTVMDRQVDRQTHGQAGGQTDTWTGRKTDRQAG